MITRHVVVVAVACVALAAGPATKPAGPVAAAPAVAVDTSALYAQAAAAYRAGDFKTAADAAEQCGREMLRQRVKPTDPAMVNAIHLHGVSLMKLGQQKRAADVLQKIYAAMAGDRVLTFNIAMCDVLGQTYAIRACKSLQSFTANHADDEQIVNLFGCALDAATREGKNPSKMADLNAAFARAEATLGATRPGMKRWGTSWMTAQEFAPIDAKIAAQTRLISETKSVRDRAVSALDAANAAFKRASAPINRNGVRSNHEWWNDHCTWCLERERRDRMDTAQREVDYRRPLAEAATADFDRETAALPKPTWAMPMEPIDPVE